MVEPHSSNFRVITTNFVGVRIFRTFTVPSSFYVYVSAIFVFSRVLPFLLFCFEIIFVSISHLNYVVNK